jgi:cytochrome b involved in lipid metabolism
MEENKRFSMEEVAKHNTADDCWVIIRNKVYNVTDFLKLHPGGARLISRDAGKDITKNFEAPFHSSKAKQRLEIYYIGDLDKSVKKVLLTPY